MLKTSLNSQSLCSMPRKTWTNLYSVNGDSSNSRITEQIQYQRRQRVNGNCDRYLCGSLWDHLQDLRSVYYMTCLIQPRWVRRVPLVSVNGGISVIEKKPNKQVTILVELYWSAIGPSLS